MTSKERLMATIKYEQVDHIPLCFKIHGFKLPSEITCKDPYERSEKWLSMGLDDILFIHSPLTRNDFTGMGDPIEFDKNVKMKTSVIHNKNEEYPLLVREYDTSEGTLRQEVCKTRDWDSVDEPYEHGGNDLILLDDYNVSRSKKFLIEKENDLRKLRHLFPPPSKEVLNNYKRYVNGVERKARDLGVLTATWASTGIDTLIWLCGVKNAIFMVYDKPDMFEELIEIVHQRDVLATQICLDLGVDMIIRRGWYEGCTFWSPNIYRRYFLPKVKEIAKLVHEGNKLFGYALTAGIMPILSDLLDIGYDLHLYIDDVQGGADFEKVKALFGGKIAILGGINEAITLERESIKVIKESVYRAVKILGKGGGFVLSATDSLFPSTPWESVKAMIEAWKKVRGLYLS